MIRVVFMSAIRALEFLLCFPVLPINIAAYWTLLARIMTGGKMHTYAKLLRLFFQPVLDVGKPK